MPRKQVYGKKARLFTQYADFISPVKREPETIEIAEIEEELGRLAVRDEDETNNRDARRRPMLEKSSNGVLRIQTPRAKSKGDKHGIAIDGQKDTTTQRGPGPETGCARQPGRIKLERKQQILPHTESETSLPSVALRVSGNSPSEAISEAPAPIVKAPPSPTNIFKTHASSLLTHSSRSLTRFDSWSDQLSSHFAVTKIAEASFGEVYRLSLLRPHPALSKSDESVLKIIALKPPPADIAQKRLGKAAKERLAMMSEPADVAGEVRLLQRMTCVPGFTNFRDVSVLQGRPSASFIAAWKSWDAAQKAKGKEGSVFPDPGKKASYGDEQLWAVIEMQDAGTDLENMQVSNVWMAWDVFWNVVLALGKGEEGARFEHRDLHLGNICVTRPGAETTPNGTFHECEMDVSKKLGFTGLETTIIDYTISRAAMGSPQLDADDDDDVAYFDLEKDPAIFQGDAAQEYQYEIYRHMRAAMFLDAPLADLAGRWDDAVASGRTWRGYHPQTNLVWLHFVLHKITEHLAWPSSCADEERSSAGEKARRQRAGELEMALLEVRQMLDPAALQRADVRSAGDVVAVALDKGWLDIQDVIGGKSDKRAQRGVRVKSKARRTKGKRTGSD